MAQAKCDYRISDELIPGDDPLFGVVEKKQKKVVEGEDAAEEELKEGEEGVKKFDKTLYSWTKTDGVPKSLP